MTSCSEPKISECCGNCDQDLLEGTLRVTNRLALILAILIIMAVAADLLLNHGAALLFLLRKFVDMVEWLAFWR
jgi:hypothetical protein